MLREGPSAALYVALFRISREWFTSLPWLPGDGMLLSVIAACAGVLAGAGRMRVRGGAETEAGPHAKASISVSGGCRVGYGYPRWQASLS